MEREEFILNIFIFIFAEDYKGTENRGLKFSQLQSSTSWSKQIGGLFVSKQPY